MSARQHRLEIVPLKEDQESAKSALKSGLDKLKLSKKLLKAIHRMLEDIAQGTSLTVFSMDRDYTTKEAAEILRFSQGHLYKLLSQGEIPFVLVGSHKRISATDLMNYKDKIEKKRRKGFAEMSRLGQELE